MLHHWNVNISLMLKKMFFLNAFSRLSSHKICAENWVNILSQIHWTFYVYFNRKYKVIPVSKITYETNVILCPTGTDGRAFRELVTHALLLQDSFEVITNQGQREAGRKERRRIFGVVRVRRAISWTGGSRGQENLSRVPPGTVLVTALF